MDASEPTRRPWLTHERTVLLVITLVAATGLGWLGWQFQIVSHRRAMLERLEESATMKCDVPDPRSNLLTIRQLLGDEQISSIRFHSEPTAADREAIGAFPEAEVWGAPDPPAVLSNP
jgi:hypothetical protein